MTVRGIDTFLKLHPLLRDRDLPVWRCGKFAMTLDELVARIVARDEVRVRRGESPRDDYRLDFESGWSGKLVIMPNFFPRDRGWTARDQFPWFLGVAPIDYKSRLEAELRRHWGDFAKHGKYAAVDEVDDIEIDRSATVYRRVPKA